ncbi:MAG: hypothetical protein SCALA702_17420 [Melioribacteraceae bacterium]|nr:MAG: hypothetical protein SCALA702_17420 [Melioribacteraceae bacterium]
MITRIILSFFLFTTILFGQGSGVILESQKDEQLILQGKSYSAPQSFPAVACDSSLNSASTFIITDESRFVYLGLYSAGGEEVNYKIFPVSDNVEEVISKVGVCGDGSGLLLIGEKNQLTSSIKIARFNTNGEIGGEFEQLPIELNGSLFFNIAISNDKTIAISWIKNKNDDTTATLMTRFYNYDLSPKSDIIVSDTDIDTTDLLNIKHEFRDDNSSMAFIYYSVFPEGNQYNKFDCAGWRSFDSNFNPDSDFYTMNLFDGVRGSDITIGPPGYFYTVEAWHVTTHYSEGPMYIKRWSRYGVQVASNTLEAAFEIPRIKFRDNKLYIFFRYHTGFGLSVLSATLDVLTYWSLISEDFPNPIMIQTILNDSDEYLFVSNGREYINGNPYESLHLQRFDFENNPLTEIFKPEAILKRSNINLIGTEKYLETKHCTIWDSDYHIDHSVYFQIRRPQYLYLDDGTEYKNIYYSDYMKDNIEHSFNKHLSSLFFSWTTDSYIYYIRTRNLGTTALNSSEQLFSGGYKVSDASVLPSGEEDFIVFLQKQRDSDSTSTIISAEFDKDGNTIQEFFNIESDYQFGVHFSNNYQVCKYNDKFQVVWLWSDSLRSNHKLLSRKIRQGPALPDSVVAQVDYTGSKITKPLKLTNQEGELYLAVQLLSGYADLHGEFALWRMLDTSDTLWGYEELFKSEDEISTFDNLWFFENNLVLFSYKDEWGTDIFDLVDTETGEVKKYDVAALSAYQNMGKFSTEQYGDEIFMVYEAELNENDVKSRALFQQTFYPKHVVVSPGYDDKDDDDKKNDDAESGQIPEKFEISGNYPNPFNPSTKIEISIPNPGYVKFEVFNSLGEIVTPSEQKLYMEGKHILPFNGDNFPSGVYYYRVTFMGEHYAGKMLLLK